MSTSVFHCAVTPQPRSLATGDLGALCSGVQSWWSAEQSRLPRATVPRINVFPNTLLSSSYIPRPVFSLPCTIPRPAPGQLETTPTAQSLLKLFKPSNPNLAHTCPPCLTKSFLEKPQHRLWAMFPPHSVCLLTRRMLLGVLHGVAPPLGKCQYQILPSRQLSPSLSSSHT